LRRASSCLALALLASAALCALAPLTLRGWVRQRQKQQIYRTVAEAPAMPVAVVFGAGYWPSGRPSDALADRMDTAIELYQAGKVNKLLLTGDNRFQDYNEPAVMAEYALARSVPAKDLVLDYAGRRTYDSCYRAGAIFGVERAILVTQAFHLPRALYTCERQGLEVVGIVADRHAYRQAPWFSFRELLALVRAWLDLNLTRPLPVLGDPIPVDWSNRTGAAQP
jgi:SanA protein